MNTILIFLFIYLCIDQVLSNSNSYSNNKRIIKLTNQTYYFLDDNNYRRIPDEYTGNIIIVIIIIISLSLSQL